MGKHGCRARHYKEPGRPHCAPAGGQPGPEDLHAADAGRAPLSAVTMKQIVLNVLFRFSIAEDSRSAWAISGSQGDALPGLCLPLVRRRFGASNSPAAAGFLSARVERLLGRLPGKK